MIANLPEESAQSGAAVSRCSQLLQQQVEPLHTDPLLQELTAELSQQVSCPLTATHTHTYGGWNYRVCLLPSCLHS